MSLPEIVERMKGLRAVVLGDPMYDVYHFGHVDRLAPEAPVPVFVQEYESIRPGGAENVQAQLEELGLGTKALWKQGNELMTAKHRYMVGTHQLLRVDQDHHRDPSYLLEENSYTHLHGANVFVISDYAKGMCTENICTWLLDGALVHGVPSVVDPKGTDWGKYEAATVLCPNQREYDAAQAAGVGGHRKVLIKQGSAGSTLIRYDVVNNLWVRDTFPAKAKHVYDVTGAGDTVTAVVAAALAAGADLVSAATLANMAAGYVVGEVGTTVCPLGILKALAQENHDAHRI